MPASTAFSVDASDARSIWPWRRPPPTFGQWITFSSDGNSPVLPDLLDKIPEGEDIGTVNADGAYDTRRCYTAIIDRQATPIRKNGRPWKEDCPSAIVRNQTLLANRHYGRAFWKRWMGYYVQSRIEA